MIIKCNLPADFDDINEIINDGAMAYKGLIPDDRWREPYMPAEELRDQIKDGVLFWCYKEENRILGVMGIQDKKDVVLIRHAYVRTSHQGQGIGGHLLRHLLGMANAPILIGTWAAAIWAIGFYGKNGFRLLPATQTETLLLTYWNIPSRQVETSVVLASNDWNSKQPPVSPASGS